MSARNPSVATFAARLGAALVGGAVAEGPGGVCRRRTIPSSRPTVVDEIPAAKFE